MKEWSYWNDLREEVIWRSCKLIIKDIDWELTGLEYWWSFEGHLMLGIILGANFSPVGYFSIFFSQKDSPFCILLSPVSPNFDGVKVFHPKNSQIII